MSKSSQKTIKCDYCDKVAGKSTLLFYEVWGDFFNGDTIVGHVCKDHVFTATDSDRCHHVTPMPLDSFLLQERKA